MSKNKKLDEQNEKNVSKQKNAKLYSMRANEYLKNSKVAEAIAEYNTAINLDPKNPEYYFQRAISLLSAGELEKGFKDFSTLKEIDPNGEFSKKIDRFYQAIDIKHVEDLTNKIRQDTANASLYQERGECYQRLKKFDKAILDFQKAIDLNTDYKDIYFDLGDCYFGMGDYEQAYKNYELAFAKGEYSEIDDEFAIKFEQIADNYRENRYYDKAFDVLNKIRDYNHSYFLINDVHITMLDIQLEKESKQKEKEIIELTIKYEREKAQVKIEERNRIIRDQAHNIKNILRSVINPLEILQRKTKSPQIDEALKGTSIIREMVNAISLSFSGLPSDFIYDAHNNDKGINLQEMIILSLEASVSSILKDAQYYQSFWEKYFPVDKPYNEALKNFSELQEIPQATRFDSFKKFVKKYFFSLMIEFGQSENFIVGNKKGSNIKILSLFNELIFNAVKYAAFVNKKDRFVKISFSNKKEFINFKIENSCPKKLEVKTSGTGNLIIDNMLEIMGGKLLKHEIINNNFITEIEFPNYWKGEI